MPRCARQPTPCHHPLHHPVPACCRSSPHQQPRGRRPRFCSGAAGPRARPAPGAGRAQGRAGGARLTPFPCVMKAVQTRLPPSCQQGSRLLSPAFLWQAQEKYDQPEEARNEVGVPMEPFHLRQELEASAVRAAHAARAAHAVRAKRAPVAAMRVPAHLLAPCCPACRWLCSMPWQHGLARTQLGIEGSPSLERRRGCTIARATTSPTSVGTRLMRGWRRSRVRPGSVATQLTSIASFPAIWPFPMLPCPSPLPCRTRRPGARHGPRPRPPPAPAK